MVSIPLGIALYFLIWWVTIFAILPFGVKTQQDAGSTAPGTDPGAPVRPHLWKKALWTTFISTLVFGFSWAGWYYLI